jgi:hypothetical protein
MRRSYPISIIGSFAIMMFMSMGVANAELSYDSQLEFATSIDEINGHILAAKKNIELENSEQAAVHLSHPIDLLYNNISSQLKTKSHIDEKLEFSLNILKNTKTNVSVDFFEMQANEIYKVLDETKLAVIPADTLNDSIFKLNSIANLLEMSKTNYILGTQSDDELTKYVLLVDSCAFVWRAQEILYSINDMELDQKYELEIKLEQTLLSISNNQSLFDINTQFDGLIDEIRMIDKSELTFQEIDVFGEAGLLEKQNKSHDFVIYEQSSVPSWIKINAHWWADGVVSDVEFLSGIEYLILENVLEIPTTSPSNTGEFDTKIPSWIKNNAGWWADGVVSDVEFLSGIEYMLEHGILTV